MTSRRPPATKISAIVSDVDGTLVTNEKQVTERTRAAVAMIQKAGLPFSIISSRPPRGIAPLMKLLEISKPSGAFNGGVIVAPDLSVLLQHLLSGDSAHRAIDFLAGRRIDTWVFSGQDWLLQNEAGPHVEHETRTVGFPPVAVTQFGPALDTAAKIVGVSTESRSFSWLARPT